jgi:predicted NACHT family NTPase
MARSLRASGEGLEIAKSVFKRKYTSQESCATDIGSTRQVVGKFLDGKAIDTEFFQKICENLGLKWQDIAELELSILRPIDYFYLDGLVREVRNKVSASIQTRCGTMRVLEMEQPITIDSIYTSVNILEKISRNQRHSIVELMEILGGENFDRFILGAVLKGQERIPALEAVKRHEKLMILGKPGAGKTTFLKWLALQCNSGRIYPNRVPFFITIKEFAETEGQPDLLGFIGKQLTGCGVENGEVAAAKILQAGRSIVLLDGLDEIKAQDHDRVLNTIRQTAEKFGASQFVITCRIAAKEYIFEQFTEVEVADFDNEQIADFAHKWFHLKDPIKAEDFPQELEDNPGLKELATNPLLLTLLCLVFESGGRFPINRAELYKEGLDVLLKKWDVKRNIKREEVYKQLSLQRKEDLLSQVAYNAFERSDYFFKQGFVEEQIRDYIQNLPNVSNDPETLQFDSEVVLNAIAAHHGLLVERASGIYSFSHLTFQEYFTARWFKEKADGDFGALISHVTDKSWREVFLLTVGMLKNADKLMLGMKLEIDGFLLQVEKLPEFSGWVGKKSSSVEASYKSDAIRAYYLARTLSLGRAFGQEQDLALALTRARARARARYLTRARNLDLDLTRGLNLDLSRDLDLARDLAFAIKSTDLQKSLQQLTERLPDSSSENYHNFNLWWPVNGQDWAEELREIMIQHLDIGHAWQFSEAQEKILQRYYDANKLLVDCLNSDCYVSREVRAEIEASLLLPIV